MSQQEPEETTVQGPESAPNTDPRGSDAPWRPQGAPVPGPGEEAKLRMLPWLVAISFFMQMLDSSILNTAIPAIASSYGEDPLQMHAVVISYMLTVAVVTPASGWLADRFGTKNVFIASIVIFTLGSLACAMSLTLGMLVAARILQGVGGGLLMPVGRLAVLKAFPRDELVRVLSFVTIPGLLGPLLGPTLGGALVHYASWHWIFLINVPVGALGVYMALRYMPELKKSEERLRFDWSGFMLFSIFMVAVTVSLEGMGGMAFPLAGKAGVFVFGVAALGIYMLHAHRTASPLFSPDLFHTRNFSVGIAANVVCRLGGGAMPLLTPLILQVGLGYSAVKAGLTMLPITLGAMVGKSFVNSLIKSAGYRWFLFFNTLMVSVMLASYALIGANTPYYVILILFFFGGVFNSLQFTAMNTVVLIDLPDKHAASGNGILSVTMQLAMGMGVAFGSAILDVYKLTGMAVLDAFHKTFYVLAVVTAASSLVFLFIRHSRGAIFRPGEGGGKA